ncbi:GyrI-like domain-containing protein [Streptomyces sp. NPDC004609]|uniref:GyrI-like domain-containing protein n=1 Tax=Streptomyces sp. NPDC004609 TaxID=3364704 RepID=UPI00367915D4
MSNDMPDIEPKVVDRAEQPYAFIRGSVRMDAFGPIADRLGELIGWLNAKGVPFAGAPFFRYNTLDMAGESAVEAGIPIASLPTPEGDIQIGTLPAGRYATLLHTGHPDELFGAITAFRSWADREGLTWDMKEVDGTERWGCRLESFLTDPRVEPDRNKWQIELSFRLADTSGDSASTP